MRTSRVSAASRPQPNVAAHTNGSGVKKEGDATSDSGLSSAPEECGSDGEQRPVKRRRTVPNAPSVVKHETKEVSPKKEARRRKARRTPAKKITGPDGTVKMEAPSNWEEMYALTREMRNQNLAPVDTMGCESLAERTRTRRDQRFQTLIALMLSSQTKDTVTAVAMRDMQENMPGGFNLESVLAIDPPALNAFISKVGFHNLKTKYIKQTAEILRDKFNSEIPDTVEGLVSLPGVGPKMAYLTMSAAWGRDEGIGVDVHVHRITNLWRWHTTQNPEQTRAALESWLPREKWHDINNLLVGFGQTICLPVGRKCGECKLAERGLCASAVRGQVTKVKREVKVQAADGNPIKKEKRAVEVAEMKAEDVDAEVGRIKVEDTASAMGDIEDIGTAEPARRTPRKRL